MKRNVTFSDFQIIKKIGILFITYFSLHDEPDSEGHVGARLGSLGAGLVSCRHGLFRWW